MDIPLLAPLTALGAFGLLLGLLASVGVGAWWRRRWGADRTVWAVVIGLVGFGASAVAVNAAEDAALELNPTVADAELVGVWQWRGATLSLDGRGAYTCAPAAACAGLGAHGHWHRSADFSLTFAAPGQVENRTRVVSFAGTLRLAEMDSEDQWPQRLTFRHLLPAS